MLAPLQKQYEYPLQDGQELSSAVMHAVSIATDTDPFELPSLYDAVDPMALDELFSGENAGTVSFEWAGCIVSVASDGTITVNYDNGEEIGRSDEDRRATMAFNEDLK